MAEEQNSTTLDVPNEDELYGDGNGIETPTTATADQPLEMGTVSGDTDGKQETNVKKSQPDETSLSVYLSDSEDEEDEILVPYEPQSKASEDDGRPNEQELYADDKAQETPAIVMAGSSRAPRFRRTEFPDVVSECSMVFTDTEDEAVEPSPAQESNDTPDERNEPSKSPSVDSGNENPVFESEAETEGTSTSSEASSATKIKIEGFDDEPPVVTDLNLPIFVPQQANPDDDDEDQEGDEKRPSFEELYLQRKAAEEKKSFTVNSSRRKDWEAFEDYDDSDSDAAEMLTKIPGGDTDSISPEQHHLDLGCMCCPCSTWCVERKLNKGIKD